MASLFHYTSLSTAIESILPKMELMTNCLTNANDPRESQLWTFGSTNLPLEEIFPNYYSKETHIDCNFKFGQLLKDKFQVLCFSGAKLNGWDNEMMWAHYGKNHAGVCLELDEQLIKEELEGNFSNSVSYLENMSYDSIKDKPCITWDGNIDIEQNIQNSAVRWYRELAFSKSHFWHKEDEKRLVMIGRKCTKVSIKSALKAIYLGLNFSHNYLPSIENYITEYEVKLFDLIYQDYRYERWERDIGSRKIPIDRKFINGLNQK